MLFSMLLEHKDASAVNPGMCMVIWFSVQLVKVMVEKLTTRIRTLTQDALPRYRFLNRSPLALRGR